VEFERRKEALAEVIPIAVKALTTAMIAMVITSWRRETPASVFRVLVVIIFAVDVRGLLGQH
jgi:hypothetical protein